jgi:hypothetical protein
MLNGGKTMTFNMESRGTNPAWGAAVNRRNKLQKQWNHWFPLRQQDPLRAMNGLQLIAEQECSRLAPLLLEAKANVEAIEREIDNGHH